jgi:L-cysteine/cystine lyase
MHDIASLATYCRERASEMPGVTVLTPVGQHGGLVALQIGDADIDEAVAYLAAAGISIRNIHENNALRISTGYYNTSQEIDITLDRVREFMKLQGA